MLNIVLVHPEIPPNTGNIARLCVACNCKLHLVRPLGFNLSDKSMRRAGLDYWKDLKLQIHDSINDFLEYAKNCRFIALSVHVENSYTNYKFSENDYIIFGSETTGLPSIFFDKYKDNMYTIPIFGNVRSLNLSNCAAIVLYEGIRQLTKK